jgi:hypothetical protein
MSNLRQLRLFVFLLAFACASAGPSLTGTWQSDDGYLAVESSRLVWLDPAHNDLSVSTVLERGEELVTRHRGRIERVRLSRSGDELAVTISGQTTTYRRVTQTPPAMSLTPLALPEPMPLPEETVKSIGAEIETRNAADQQLLKAKAPLAEIRATEAANGAWLRETALRYGWIDAERFGGKASGAATVMAKHATDTRLLLAAIPLMKKDLARDAKFAQTFAIAYDQLLLSLGERQRYGSQVCSESGTRPFLCAVEKPSELDARRTAIGLPPLAEYLGMVSQMLYKNEPVRVPGDEDLQ